jgi:branched-subunit amino acid transport protein
MPEVGTDLSIPVLILGMALINLGIRWPVFLLADRFRFPPLIERALAFVPATVLTAIIVPAVIYPHGGTAELNWRNPYLLAAVITALISYFGRNLLATITLGMIAFLVLRWWLGA